MIWLFIGCFLLVTLLFLAAPLYRKNNGVPPGLLALLLVVFSFAALGVYAMIGRPELTSPDALQRSVMNAPQGLTQMADPRSQNDMSMDQLVARLKMKLEENPKNPDGWMLYARSLINLGRYDEAFIAYEKVLTLTGNNSNVAEELAQARDYVAQRRGGATLGPSAEDVRAAQQMSADERRTMIEGMVESLSEKLRDNPQDEKGWIRLLKSRRVLNQNTQAELEIARLKSAFPDDPIIVTRILEESGWAVSSLSTDK